MAYNKKNWQDNVSDITAAELNRMEQGIYDNSLVVDAITNTINPTDTETYKTAELTEGQITDVIGVSDIIIKGQTSQNGEPTPSSPVDVNVVSGSNVINTSNKNLYGTEIKTNNISTSSNTIVTDTSDKLEIQGTGGFYSGIYKKYKLQANISYTISLKNSYVGTNSSARIAYKLGNECDNIANSNNDGAIGVATTTTSLSFTTDSTGLVAIAFFCNWATNTGKVIYNNIQIEQSSTATAYEPHQGKELPLDLPVENLLNVSFVQGSYNSDATLDRISCRNVRLKANTTYSLSSNLNYNNFNIALGTSTELFPHTTAFIYDSGWKNANFSFTTGNVDVYSNISIKKTNNSNITPNDVSEVQFQLEKGSKANAYTPYGTDTIELCKIGNYQDYFYKSGSKWYLHKEIEKIIANGSENWALSSGIYVLSRLSTNTHLANSTLISNLYEFITAGELQTKNYGIRAGNADFLQVKNVDITSLENFKTFLSTNNLVVYYILQTATNTEITDTTLISQLEAIYNAPLYEQTNITQTNNDLPMVLDITACKDNINGIKAFIRK